MKKNKAKIRPLGDRVLLVIDKNPEKTSLSGIIIPDTVGKERPEQGLVVAAGEGRVDEAG
ncbi:MAG: Co-chaperonin GroES, partial [Patescibacteria group bacterium]|nr:Co-chaperonin GroES [Patescibacteria group bacterium]